LNVNDSVGRTPAGVAARYAAAVSGRSAERRAPGANPKESGSAAGWTNRSRKTESAGSVADSPTTDAGASASAIRLSVLGQSHGSSTAALPTAFPGTRDSFVVSGQWPVVSGQSGWELLALFLTGH
jgi:hypothetical protein